MSEPKTSPVGTAAPRFRLPWKFSGQLRLPPDLTLTMPDGQTVRLSRCIEPTVQAADGAEVKSGSDPD